MNTKPLVLHITGSLEGGGAERWVQELVPRINARGVVSDIVTVYPPRIDSSALKSLGCRVFHRPKRPGFDIVHFFWLYNLIRTLRPEIVHTHQWAGKYVGRSAAILARTPHVVHTEHSPLSVSRRERFMASVLSFKTDAVISFDSYKADLIRARERVDKFEIIRNGIPISAKPSADDRDAARRMLIVDDGTIIFGVVGSLQERKNPLLALRAFARMRQHFGVASRLDFFGEGPLRASIEQEAQQLGVSKHVRFHGFRSDVRAYLAGLDVFVTLATAEMAPISMLEAMAAQLPIIGAPHSGTLEMIEDGLNGTVVDWNLADVSAAMLAARDDAEWRHSCGVAGRLLVERDYDIERITDKHVELYDRLIHDRPERNGGLRPAHFARSSAIRFAVDAQNVEVAES